MKRNQKIKTDNKISLWTIGLIGLLSIFLVFHSASHVAGDIVVSKVLSVIVILSGLLFAFINRKGTEYFKPSVFAVSAYVMFQGISTLYANSGKFAINEYVKVLFAFGVFLFVLFAKNKEKMLSIILWTITSFSAIIAFLSIEGTGLNIVNSVIESIFYGQDVSFTSSFDGIRISGFFGNPNVLASFLGVSIFCSLYLYFNEENKIKKHIQGCFLMIMALAFMLGFSMFGTFSMALATLGFVFFSKGENRIKALVCVAEVLLITFLALFIVTPIINQKNIIPVLILAVTCVLFIFADKFVGKIISNFLNKHQKATFIGIFVLIGLAVIFALVAFSITSSLSIAQNQHITRIIYPQSGTYSINFEFEDDSQSAYIEIYTRDERQILLSEMQSTVFVGEISNETSGSLTVSIPEGTVETRILIINRMESMISLDRISLENETSKTDVPTSYVLLPENISSRLQGLPTNYSFTTRMQYVEDSIKLFMQSPIIGHGLGGFENAIQSVQEYNYETKYAHNHFLQALVDTGIIGFILYVSLIISLLIPLFKCRSKKKEAPFLFGALLMIIFHCSVDFSMSFPEFICLAFVIFALISANCDSEIKVKESVKKYPLFAIIGVTFVFSILLIGNISANLSLRSSNLTLDTLKNSVGIDVYEKNDLMLSYVMASVQFMDDEEVQNTAKDYLVSLENAKSNSISLYLTEYYITVGDNEKSFEMFNRYIDYSLYDQANWNNAINSYINSAVTSVSQSVGVDQLKTHAENVKSMITKLQETNQTAVDIIELDGVNQVIIRNILAAENFENSSELTEIFGRELYNSNYNFDSDSDGLYDSLIASETTFDIENDTPVAGDKIGILVPSLSEGETEVRVFSDKEMIIRTNQRTLELENDNGNTVAYLDSSELENGVIIEFLENQEEKVSIKITN